MAIHKHDNQSNLDGINQGLSTSDNVSFGNITASADLKQQVHTDDVSNPPTDAELDSAFGAPATVGAGFIAYLDDAGGGSNFYQVVSDGTNWWYFTGTKAA